MEKLDKLANVDPSSVAIIGMAGRFPSARNVAEFWSNLRNGVESISFFTEAELAEAGTAPAVYLRSNFVRAGGVLDGVDLFAASFFGYSPREAEIIDPQHRLFLEVAWEALENAGYDSESYDGSIGIFAGAALSTYMMNLVSTTNILSVVGIAPTLIANQGDYLTTRVSYKLNLRGPSVNVQTACSTSLVAVHLACQNLLNGECHMALAGGVTIINPQKGGYWYQEGGVLSPDGHCRAFDARAQGTVGGNGVGIVVLKRFADAIADGDTIHAVIRGSAINNDGSAKVGYTAPSVSGQAGVIAEAQAIAGIEPEEITYVEAHGTATPLGDPIEVQALTQAFRTRTRKKNFCGVGSVKTNIGHLDTAAGVAGLIKTVLALKHKELPPSLNFEQPNPILELENSPFYINDTLRPWECAETPRRAGVSSFGIGGTNAHVVLEEAPVLESSASPRPAQLLVLSAKTDTALETITGNLLGHLKSHPEANLADVAYTLQVGRRAFNQRRTLVCSSVEDAVSALETFDLKRVLARAGEPGEYPVMFMFSGQGSQYVQMGRGLYDNETVFRRHVDECAELLKQQLGGDLREMLYPSAERSTAAAEQLAQTRVTQPALFVIEYALAKLWMAWGVTPGAMIGHSIGEYVAACLAGVFSLEDALRLVAARGALMQEMPPGAMLAVPLAEEALRPLLDSRLSLAAVNAPSLSVVSGPGEAIAELQRELERQELEGHLLHTSHAFHSEMMEPMLARFTEQLKQVNLGAPQLPFISNVTGTWITAEQATDARYWASHVRQAVRFADGARELLQTRGAIMLEVGPGRTLSTLVRQQPVKDSSQTVLTTLRHPHQQQCDVSFILQTLGQLWLNGVKINWRMLHAGEERRRVPLPTYPFERQRYWLEPSSFRQTSIAARPKLHKKSELAEWFYRSAWKQAARPAVAASESTGHYLVFVDADGVGAEIASRLEREGRRVTTVARGEHFNKTGEHAYTLNPSFAGEYDDLLTDLQASGGAPQVIVHCWSVAAAGERDLSGAPATLERKLDEGFYSLLYLAQGLNRCCVGESVHLVVVSSATHDVTGEEQLCPENATLLGLCKVIPQEYPNLICRSVDVLPHEVGTRRGPELIKDLVAEVTGAPSEPVVAYRGKHRWVQTFEANPTEAASDDSTLLRERGVYLITGGLGRIGLLLAEHLARTVKARLILLSHSTLPAKDEWRQWLDAHEPNTEMCRRIRAIQELENEGAEVLTVSADVADEEQMRAAVSLAVERFGEINGVIHAVAGKAITPLQETGRAECDSHFQPKMYGLIVLERVLRGRNLDFSVLLSSLASVLGGLGYAAYAAANSFMDAFAGQQNGCDGASWISVDLDGWRFDGDQESAAPASPQAELTMTPAEGLQVLERTLTRTSEPQIVVSTGDLHARIAQWIKLKPYGEEPETDAAGNTVPLHERPEIANAYVAPTNETQQRVAVIWQQLLGIERIGIDDNFLELGGHSLLATQVVSRLRKSFGVEVSLRSMLETPTIAGMAEGIEAAQQAAAGLKIPPLLPVPRDRQLPLSFAQQRLWFLHRLEPDNPVYNLSTAFRLTGQLKISAVRWSLDEVVRRHESLRTTVAEVDGEAVQNIAPVLSVALPIIDLKELPVAERESHVRRLAEQEAQRPFDLSSGPLVRAVLLRTAPDEHVMLFTMHHIVSDGWSMGLLVQEVTALYEAFVAGRPSPLVSLPIQYADFAVWQREWLQGEALDEQLDYWKRQLGGELPVLELPAAKPRPSVQSFRGEHRFLQLSAPLSEAVKELSRREGATLFMTLLAAFDALLYRYTGQQDILIGTPSANRNRAETEPLIGFFINTLVMRTRLTGELGFRELLANVREVTTGAYAHQDLPFDTLVMSLHPERSLSHMPLFQVAFNIYNFPSPPLELPGITLGPVEAESGAMPYDLILTIREGEQGLLAGLGYSTDLFEAATAEQMLRHFELLLQGIVARPEQKISELPLLTDEERHRLLTDWNDTNVFYQTPVEHCLHTLFEAQVERTPDAVAVIFEGQRLTYRELNERANQLAHHLWARGVAPEVRVGLCAERSIEMVVGLLGILKAGGVYVPLDPAYPQERLSFMLADAQVRVLLTQERLRGMLSSDAAQVISLDAQAGEFIVERTQNPGDGAATENLAYVIYTSGSTGRPKGVMVTHRAICNRVLWMCRQFPLEPADRVLQKTPFSFDASIWEFFLPLFSGAQLVMARPGGHQDSAYLVEAVREHEVKILQLVPSMLRVFLGEEGVEECRGLRHLFCGGEKLTVSDRERFYRKLNGQLHNLYGPTEASIDATYWRCEAEESKANVPIGRPIANVRVYLLDRHLQPVVVGSPGELHIGGVGLARGYLNGPELTAERFIPDPFSVEPGERLYRTGDLARYTADGRIEYLGRIDQQVKLHGFRIEVGEIEFVLCQKPGVKTAAVLVREDDAGAQRLVAYVVPEHNGHAQDSGLQLYRLPNDLQVAHLNRSETDVMYTEVFEEGGYLRHGVMLNDGDCVFDVGANIGLFTLFVHTKCQGARVFSFEPIPPTFETLTANINFYGLNVKAFQCAVSSAAGTAEFTFYPKAPAASGMYPDAAEEEKVTRAFIGNQGELGVYADELVEGRFEAVHYRCQLRTLSEVIREEGVERIDLLKVDVEKSELDVLLGIAEEDWGKIKQVVLEVHDTDRRLAAITELLDRHGFKFVVEQDRLLQHTNLYNIYAVHSSKVKQTSAQSNGSYETAPLHLSKSFISAAELQEFLEKKLPQHMVPPSYIILDELPVLPNGKLDRRALLSIDDTRPEANLSVESRKTPTEEVLAQIWCGVLGIDSIGAQDNFFDLGGHSLLAMQVMSRVRRALRVELRVRTLFESPTLAALAECVARARTGAPAADTTEQVSAAREPPAEHFPLSYAQLGIWQRGQLNRRDAENHLSMIVRLRGRLDFAALEQALNELVRRQSILRTAFAEVEGQPAQIISESCELPLRVLDLSAKREGEREEQARLLARAHALEPFDLSRAPLLRVTVLQMAEHEHELLITAHPLVADSWSRFVLLRDLVALYRAAASGIKAALAELPVQYAELAQRQREWLAGEVAAGQLLEWRERLEGAPALALPTNHARTPESSSSERRTLVLESELLDALKIYGRENDCTLFMTLLAVLQTLLHHYTGQTDILVATDVPSRDEAHTKDLLGPFSNQLVLRTDLSGDPTFKGLLGRVREVTLDAYAHQHIPFEKLLETWETEGEMDRAPLPRVKFIHDYALPEALENAGLRFEPLPASLAGGRATADLVLEVIEAGPQLFASFEYDAGVFGEVVIEQLPRYFEMLLRRVVETPEAPLSELLEILAAEDRQQRLAEEEALERVSLKALKGIRRRSVTESKMESV